MGNPETNKVAKRPDLGQSMVQNMMAQVDAFAIAENTPLTDVQRSFAVDTILKINKKISSDASLEWKQIDIIGCALPQQIKRFARLGLSFDENEIYIDIRNNSKTKKKDIKILKQYQGLEKEMVKWLRPDWKISRPFKKDVILLNEEVIVKEDFDTGFDKIVGHKRIEGSRNDWDKIIGAYQIAYVDIPFGNSTKTIQIFAKIDKDRLQRAWNASPSKEKAVWKLDTKLMCLKTATWVLYDKVIKPFMEIPIEFKDDWQKSNTQMDFDKANAIEEVEYATDNEANKKTLVVGEGNSSHNPTTGEITENCELCEFGPCSNRNADTIFEKSKSSTITPDCFIEEGKEPVANPPIKDDGVPF